MVGDIVRFVIQTRCQQLIIYLYVELCGIGMHPRILVCVGNVRFIKTSRLKTNALAIRPFKHTTCLLRCVFAGRCITYCRHMRNALLNSAFCQAWYRLTLTTIIVEFLCIWYALYYTVAYKQTTVKHTNRHVMNHTYRFSYSLKYAKLIKNTNLVITIKNLERQSDIVVQICQ